MKYNLITKDWRTNEVISEEVFEHYPTKEAWEKELNNYNVKCEIQKLCMN